MRLENKVAIVTGGGSGLGKKIGEKLAAEGAKVALADISLENAAKAAEEICKLGVVAKPFAVDVSDEEQVRRMFAEVEKAFGGIDLLYNNAGISPVGTVETTSYQDFSESYGHRPVQCVFRLQVCDSLSEKAGRWGHHQHCRYFWD